VPQPPPITAIAIIQKPTCSTESGKRQLSSLTGRRALKAAPVRRFHSEATGNIYVGEGRRPIQPAIVADLAASLRAMGLLTPIVVRHVEREVVTRTTRKSPRLFRAIRFRCISAAT
jgi:hypothetical protein